MPPRTSLSHCLSLLSEVVPEDAATLVKDVPQEQILQALYATGTASIRHRKLPAAQMVWLVIGLSLFRHLSIVQDRRPAWLGGSRGAACGAQCHSPSARATGSRCLCFGYSRRRRKSGPITVPSEHAWHGLGVYGVDGTTMRVADSPENRDYFGGTQTPARKAAGIRCVGLVALMALRSHLLAAVAFGPYDNGQSLGTPNQLWEQLPDDSLVILDRGFVSAALMWFLQSQGKRRNWLIRGKKNLKLRTVRRLGPGDELVEMKVSRRHEKRIPNYRW